jgi:hypothetical protein
MKVQRGSRGLSLTSALDGGGWTRSLYVAGDDLVPMVYWRLVGPQGQSGCVWKILPPLGFDPRIVQSSESAV